MTHTKGPWQITLHGNGLVDGDYRYQIGTNAQTVAYAWMGRTDNDPELQANARLIAASPILYEYALNQAKNGCQKAKEMLASLKLTNEA